MSKESRRRARLERKRIAGEPMPSGRTTPTPNHSLEQFPPEHTEVPADKAKEAQPTKTDPPTVQPADSPNDDLPWYESTTLWRALGAAVAIVLVVVAAMVKDLRSLLAVAWPFFCLAGWAALKGVKKWSIKWALVGATSCLLGLGLLWLHAILGPPIQDNVASAKPAQPTTTTPSPTNLPAPPLTEAQIEAAVRKALPPSIITPPFSQREPADPAAFGDAPTDDLFIVSGSNVMHARISEMKDKRVQPFQVGGDIPFSFYFKAGQFFVDATLFGGPGRAAIEVRANKITMRNGLWDSNHTDKAMEVVTQDGTPVLQIIRRGLNRIEADAIVPMPEGGPVWLITPSGIRFAKPTDYSLIHAALRPIFKYPSWKFMGVFAE
jgi:hypothetical protein